MLLVVWFQCRLYFILEYIWEFLKQDAREDINSLDMGYVGNKEFLIQYLIDENCFNWSDWWQLF